METTLTVNGQTFGLKFVAITTADYFTGASGLEYEAMAIGAGETPLEAANDALDCLAEQLEGYRIPELDEFNGEHLTDWMQYYLANSEPVESESDFEDSVNCYVVAYLA